jgi:hypothetical protein
MANKTGTQTPVIYNAVYNALIAASLASSAPANSAPALPTTAQATNADAIASNIDTAIGVVASLASAASVTIVPATAAEANALATIPLAIFGITYSWALSRYLIDPTIGDFSTLTGAIETVLANLRATNCIT